MSRFLVFILFGQNVEVLNKFPEQQILFEHQILCKYNTGISVKMHFRANNTVS